MYDSIENNDSIIEVEDQMNAKNSNYEAIFSTASTEDIHVSFYAVNMKDAEQFCKDHFTVPFENIKIVEI